MIIPADSKNSRIRHRHRERRTVPRAPNMMKHACVAARIGDGKAPGEGNSSFYCQDEQRGVAWRAEQVPSAVCLDATPQGDRKRTESTRFSHPSAVASPQAGASEGGRGFPLGSDPGDAQRDQHVRAHDRLHGRIPVKRGPCSALRRSLLHAAVRRRFWLQPFGLARVLAQHIVASHLLRITKSRVLLRVLSQNRDSASRVSSC
jgi:hypothetical protein